jgi:hypothetical protein
VNSVPQQGGLNALYGLMQMLEQPPQQQWHLAKQLNGQQEACVNRPKAQPPAEEVPAVSHIEARVKTPIDSNFFMGKSPEFQG